MKYNIKNQLVLIALTFVFFGCQKQLDDLPHNSYSEVQVFSTEAGTETAVNGMYYYLEAYDYYGNRMPSLLWPHSGKYHSKQGSNVDANKLQIINSNVNMDKLWRGMYKTINQCNLVIKNVTGSGLANEDSSLGQAYFIRGVTYFDLARMFGEVPLRLEPTTTENIPMAKSSKEELYNQVISDFKKAADLLPDRSASTAGRPLKYAANAYLAKVYVTLAGSNDAAVHFPNFNPVTESEISVANISNFWEEARDELDYVINNGGYSLTPTFAELFADGSENTSESIFELQYGHTGAVRTSDYIRMIVPKNNSIAPTGITTFGKIRPNKEMFSDHIIQYSGIDFSGAQFIPAGTNGDAITLDPAVADPRIEETFIYNSYNQTTNGAVKKVFPLKKKGNDAYAYLKKYRDLSYDGTTTECNVILYRYADVLLLRAEVENELNGPASAFQYVNQVLARARNTATGTSVYPEDWDLTSITTQEVFRKRIMKEREYELNGEGHEWFDMRRRGLGYFQEQIDHHNAAVQFYGSANNKDYIFNNVDTQGKLPIPLAEISGNNLIDN